ncbi:MAG: DNA methyltransferase, partial [Pseudomonas sp.]
PYTVAHANNGFVKYNENIFSWADQIRLAEHAKRLAARGCFVAVSNADHVSVDALYGDFNKIMIERFSVMAASSAFRRKITECLYFLGGDFS